MDDGFLGILTELSKREGAVTFSQLTGFVRGFKALPANGKRWKKGERAEQAEICFRASYEDAMQLISGKESRDIAFTVWVPRKEFTAMVEAEKAAAPAPADGAEKESER